MEIGLSKEKAEAIFNEYSDFVYKAALFLTNSKALADDITQETFIQVFRKYHTYDPSRDLKPWMYKIALNITRNTLRKQKWLRFVDQLPEKSCGSSIEGSVLKNEEEKELWKEISNLSLKNKEIILLHFYSGMKLKEISDMLGIPLGTCKSRLNGALNVLRKRFPQNDFKFIGTGGDVYEPL